MMISWPIVLIGKIMIKYNRPLYILYINIVVVSYEIQLTESARNNGLGEYLMGLLSHIGSYWQMDKVMLTVFKGKKKREESYLSCR